MNTAVGLIILAEALFALFIIWGFMHEDRFIRFENRISEAYRSRKARRSGRAKHLRLVVDRSAKEDPDFSAA